MFNNEEIQTSINDMKEGFFKYNTQILEFHMSILKEYQKILNDQLFQETEKINKLFKGFMSAYFDLIRLERENRKNFIKTQSDIIDNIIDNIENNLKNIRNQKGPLDMDI